MELTQSVADSVTENPLSAGRLQLTLNHLIRRFDFVSDLAELFAIREPRYAHLSRYGEHRVSLRGLLLPSGHRQM